VKRRLLLPVLVAGVLLATATTAQAGDPIQGAGSTFAGKVMTAWAQDVAAQGVNVTYTGTGSGDGRTRLIAGQVDFAGSDVPPPPAEGDQLKATYGDYVVIPVTSGGISVVYNVAEFPDLKLSGPTIAKIFTGKITNWNDPAVATDNGAPGPDLPIKVFVRADRSGSSAVFSAYLTEAGGGEYTGGQTELFPAPANGEGKEGGSAVAQAVLDTRGGVGYTDHAGAISKALDEVRVLNPAGKHHGPEAQSVQAAIDEATINPDGTVTPTYVPKGELAYPISTVTYMITPAKLAGAKAETLKAFLDYGLSQPGQDKAIQVGYAPFPEKMLAHGKAQAAKVSAG
jgi:phosphate transport system substrate-binding protein